MKKIHILSTLFLAFTLTVTAQTKPDYKMAGPFEVVARDGQYGRTKGGSERDMMAAYDFAMAWQQASHNKNGLPVTTPPTELNKKPADLSSLSAEEARDKALAIINAYATTLQRLDGHDAPLCAIQGYALVEAMTILHAYKTPEWDAMLRRAWLPTLDEFERNSPYANGNWGAIVNRMRMACAIYLEDKALYEHAVDYFLYANDNGALPRYVGPTGQCQETGRDQGHAQLGLEALEHICEMAYLVSQHTTLCEKWGDIAKTDLWGALDNRLLKGIEYTARYNLGYDVPFETWQDCTGLYCEWTKPGEMGRGRLWDIYELPYKHYHGRLGLDMPYTKQAIDLMKDAKRSAKNEQRLNKPAIHRAYTYAAPQGAPLKHDYDVYIQSRGSKEWTKIDTYMAKVNAPTRYNAAPGKEVATGTGHKVTEISYAFFDFEGVVSVRVVCKNKKYKTARIRPDYRGTIANVQNDSTVQFMLFQPENLSVEFDGNITDNLLLFTSRPPVSVEEARKEAKKQGRSFVYVAPGLYDDLTVLQAMMPKDKLSAPTHPIDVTESSAPVSKEVVRVPSGTTVYLAPGAYVNGTFAIDDVSEVSLLGRGVCRPTTGFEGARVHRSRNVLLDGLVVNTCPIGGSNGVTVHDVKSISYPGWGDGLNVFASQNVHYNRVFCRNSDDCTTAYCTRKGFKGNCLNVTMENSILWADVAHPIFIGLHGNAVDSPELATHPEKGDTCAHLLYKNIDILCQSEAQMDYQGCMAVNAGDNNLVEDITFENIRVEQINQGSLLNLRIFYNEKYCAAPGRAIRNVNFNLIRYYGLPSEPSLMMGYDADRNISGVHFRDLRINGQRIHDKMPGKPGWYKTWDFMRCLVGNHVKDITFE